MRYLAVVWLWLGALSINVVAQIDQPKEIATSQTFGDYTLHYNVFNTSNLPASVAQTYNLVRGKNRALVNISVTKTQHGQTSLGLPAVVSVKTRNLMQQSQTLKVIEIDEGDAVYYLAPFRFYNEELLHFDVVLQYTGERPFKVTFNRTLYTD